MASLRCKLNRHDWEKVESHTDLRIQKVLKYQAFWKCLFEDYPVGFVRFFRCKRCGKIISPEKIEGIPWEKVDWNGSSVTSS